MDSSISQLLAVLDSSHAFDCSKVQRKAHWKSPQCTFTFNYGTAVMKLSRKFCCCHVAWHVSTSHQRACCAPIFCFAAGFLCQPCFNKTNKYLSGLQLVQPCDLDSFPLCVCVCVCLNCCVLCWKRCSALLFISLGRGAVHISSLTPRVLWLSLLILACLSRWHANVAKLIWISTGKSGRRGWNCYM